MQESSVSGTISETLDSTKKYPHFHGSRERKYYTRIFVTFSPYRSFFFVIFLLVRANPKIATQNPKKPIQKSESIINGVASGRSDLSESWSADIPLEVVTTIGESVWDIVSVSMRKSERIIIVIPIENTVHFQIFFRTIPGSSIHRSRPTSGKK